MTEPLKKLLDNTSVVLVRPAHPGNIGSTARAMKNMGFFQMAVVAPLCNPLDDDALRMAYGAQDLLRAGRVVPTLVEAISDSRFVVGLTGHDFQRYEQPAPLSQAAPEIIAYAMEHPIALLFGSEGTGLSQDEIARCHRLVTIPTPGPHPSLNLSQAVMVVVYELTRGLPARLTADPIITVPTAAPNNSSIGTQSSIPQTPTPISKEPATVLEMEYLYQAWEELLTKSQMIRGRQGESTLTRIRRILSRAPMDPQEARMLQGILRQVVWQLEHPKEAQEHASIKVSHATEHP